MVFAVRTCLGARMAPKSTPRAPKLQFLKHFWSILEYFLLSSSPLFFGTFLSFLSAPAVGRRSNRKQNADDWSGHGCGEAEGKWI